MDELVKFIRFPDGRRIAYRELGCRDRNARRSLIVLHGLLSSRLFAIPGVSEDMLREFGVRLVAIDRPGYGQSDPHPSQTFYTSSKDIEAIIDELHLGDKIWLLSFSMGGPYCWAAARYIPDRIAGIAMCCPVGNFWWKDISEEERKAIISTYSTANRALSALAKRLPFFLFRYYVRYLCTHLVDSSRRSVFQKGLSPPDRKCLERPGVFDFMFRDRLESLIRSKGFGMAKDFQLLRKAWGFELEDVGRVFRGPIHIWQGDEDWLVPLSLQKLIKRRLPEVVQLHEVQGEGHFSWLCFNDTGQRRTLSTLFGEDDLAHTHKEAVFSLSRL